MSCRDFVVPHNQPSPCLMLQLSPLTMTTVTAGTSKKKSNAERQREYRQRQKHKNIPEEKKREPEIQQFTEILSQESQCSVSQIHIQDETAAGTSGTIQNVPHSSKETQRRRQKIKNIQEANRRKAEAQDFREKLNSDERKLRNAAYSKVYRDRKKIQLSQESQCSMSNENFAQSSEEPQRKRKSNAERQREYRLRKKFKNILEDRKKKTETQKFMEKLLQESQRSMSQIHVIQVEVVTGTSGTTQNVPESSQESHYITNFDITLTHTDGIRENTDRKKNKNIPEEKKREPEKQQFTEILSQESQCMEHSQIHIQGETVAGTHGTIQNVPDSSEESQRKRKSNAERQGEYRRRQKINIPEENRRKAETQKFTEKLNSGEIQS
ncbi:unnamed protein product [Leptidea sinapis]|uniref:Uncharacterized protein n=1 Tax=Leptidea sinapis TaxID=189913 RepID=A0A5E4QCS8_9NEOP|nr:unnamed protein product [Leptidea sinapis]